jgi:cytochrome P450
MRERVHALFGLDAAKGQTVRCQRTVLVVVHSPVMVIANMLRRSGPATSIRTALNPLFAPPATERWRGSIKLLARARAAALPCRADLVRDFCALLAEDLAGLTAGMKPDEWQCLNRLGARANARVLTGHDDIDEARTELHYPGRSLWV